MKCSWNATVQSATELFLELSHVAQSPLQVFCFPVSSLVQIPTPSLSRQKKLVWGGGNLLYENSWNLPQSGQFSKIQDDKNRKTYRLKTYTNLDT